MRRSSELWARAILCMIEAVRISLLLVSGPLLPLSAVATRALHPTTGANTPSIADWHLFGTPGNTQPALAASQLALTLRGTFATADPGDGLAFIAGADGREHSYAVGEIGRASCRERVCQYV